MLKRGVNAVNHDALLKQLPKLLQDWIPDTASIAVANRHRYIAYRPGAHDLRIVPGEAVRPGSIAERVFAKRDRVESDVDSSVFGIPYHGLGYPLQLDNGVESAVAVILPPQSRATPASPPQPLSYLMGHANGVWRPIPVEAVVYCESYEKKTWFYTQRDAFTTSHTLQALSQRLPGDHFLRIHRSYIINVGCIDYIERDERSNLIVTLKNDKATRLPVAQSYVRHVRQTLGF